MIGAERVIWRYDPIIISNLTGCDFHKAAFAGLCAQLKQHTQRVVISVVDYYGKTKRNLKPLEEQLQVRHRCRGPSGNGRTAAQHCRGRSRGGSGDCFLC